MVASGGIGHNFTMMRKNWPVDRIGPAPKHLIAGVPAHVDGRMLAITETAGGRVVNPDGSVRNSAFRFHTVLSELEG